MLLTASGIHGFAPQLPHLHMITFALLHSAPLTNRTLRKEGHCLTHWMICAVSVGDMGNPSAAEFQCGRGEDELVDSVRPRKGSGKRVGASTTSEAAFWVRTGEESVWNIAPAVDAASKRSDWLNGSMASDGKDVGFLEVPSMESQTADDEKADSDGGHTRRRSNVCKSR